MIHVFAIPEKKALIQLYRDDISKEDIEYLIEQNKRIFLDLKLGEKYVSYADFRGAKAVNSELNKMLADFVKENGHFYQKIYVSGFSAFMTILFKAYLVLSNSGNLHQSVSLPYEDFLKQEGIPVPIETNIKISTGYIGSSRRD